MKIAVLDMKSIGADLDYNVLATLGDLIIYEYTEASQVVERLKDVDVVVSNKIIFNEEVIVGAKTLKLICMTGTGYNNIDIKAAKANKVGVCNVKDYCTESVVQHTFAMVLHLLNNLSYYQKYVGEGIYIGDEDFKHYEVSYRELSALRWGIIGMGNIGQEVAKIAKAFGSEVVYYSTSGLNNEQSYQQVSYEQLIEESDIITIHSPLNAKTLNLIDKKALSKMKKDVIIVNVGRGGIVNESDAVDALLTDKIGGLGIDVFTSEPMSATSPYIKILNNPRALLTPHVAWASIEARQRVINEVGKNIKAFASGGFCNRIDI